MNPEITEILARIAELNDAELGELETRLVEELEAAGTEELSDEVLATMTSLADGIEAVRTQTEERATKAAEREAARLAILARIAPAAEGDEGEEDPEDEAEAEGTVTPAEDPPAEGEGAPPPAAPVIKSVAAAVKPIRRNTLRTLRPRPTSRIVAAFGSGEEMHDILDVAKALQARHRSFRGPTGVAEQSVVASVQVDYPEERMLGENAVFNQNLIDAVVGAKALVASGGLCAPLNVSYSLMDISTAARPVRDSLPTFGATRGGIRFIAPADIADFASAVTKWTAANDANPSAPATKACLHVACGDEVEVVTQAIVRCLEFGNLGARAFPEQVADALSKTIAAHARIAERALLTLIGTNSTAVTSGELLGASRDILSTIERAAVAVRNRQRMAPGSTLRLILPEWAKGLMRTDVLRQLPGDSTMAVADAVIANWFAVRSIAVTYALEGVSGQDFGAQGVGPLQGWPTNVVMYLFPEGSHLFLDGGVLDLGLVRDSTLNSTNDYQIFAETFESTAFVGLESLKITANVCPSGMVSGSVDLDPCATGS